MRYTLVNHAEESTITAYAPDGLLVAHSDHPNFRSILEGLIPEQTLSDAEVADLFEIPKAIAKRFEPLTERVSAANGKIYFDGDEIHDALTTQILRVMEEGEDFTPLVYFFEKVQANPNEHSREQLYNWLDTYEFSITADGDIVGYKGVSHINGVLKSGSTGVAYVNGERIEGHIPNPLGAVVTMPRSEVVHDPSDGCSTGLHVGTHSYALTYARGALLEVHVNPRDVVSVPTDCDHQKMRVCRYRVVREVLSRYTSPVVPQYGAEDIEEHNAADEWGPTLHWATPSEQAFDAMRQRAKRLHRSFVKYATKHGPWTLVGDDPTDRHSWEVSVG